jgi:hypothetical protein
LKEEYSERKAEQMPITDVDQTRVVQLIVSDLHGTLGTGHDYLARKHAVRTRQFVDDVPSYVQRVVEDTQQNIHDEFVDTVWPRCPRHAHPLWFRDGFWWCTQDDLRVAALGELKTNSAI